MYTHRDTKKKFLKKIKINKNNKKKHPGKFQKLKILGNMESVSSTCR